MITYTVCNNTGAKNKEKSINLILTGETNDTYKNVIYKRVGKLVEAGWANIGSWIYFLDKSGSDNRAVSVLTISFHVHYEDMGMGGPKSYVVDRLIELVNNKYNSEVKME